MKTSKIQISKDGRVTFWGVYEQQWKLIYASRILDRDLATMSRRNRDRIARAAKTEFS